MINGDLGVILLAAAGVLLMLISAVGILRLERVHAQMHAAGIASTVGIGAVLLAAGIHFDDQLWRMLLLATFFLITAPVATTAISRAAYVRDREELDRLAYNVMAHESFTDSVLIQDLPDRDEHN